MKALLAAEGQHERSGALQTLVAGLAPTGIEFVDVEPVNRNDIHAFHGSGSGYFKRAIRWLLEARKRGRDALILLIDEDGRRERIYEINRAQDYETIRRRRAFGVAIRTFDAWMLADERALTSVFGCPVGRQPDPETIADPKQRCKDLHESSQSEKSLRDIYTSIAEVADLRTMQKRCPRGFAPFASRVRRLQ